MIPEIRNDPKGIPTLYVGGEPFFCLAGELHNSSASSLDYMEREVWPKLEGLNMNSVILPLYWECIEPREGIYDFTLLEGIIAQARSRKMKLIFLWFGLWKNAESMYAPGWMKQDSDTYFRARKVNGEPINTISPLCDAAVEKDRLAFTAVMSRIRELDEEQSTVLFMQVENEIGLLGTPRDYCDTANAAFARIVPVELAEKLGLEAGRNWKETFGEDAEESFMAYWFAKAVETITASGRTAYPLPCYANAWLRQYPWYPGSYPSGGPVVEVHPIWKATAPSLFTLAPDIYVPYVPKVLDEYAYAGNPLVIPEVRKDAVTAAYCLYAFGQHNAICYSPFGIEELNMDPALIDRPPMEVMIALNIDPSAFDIAGSNRVLAKTYDLVNQMKPLYLEYRGTPHMRSFIKHEETDFGTYFQFADYNLSIAYGPKISGKPIAGGIVYELAPNKFLIIGMQCSLTFQPKVGVNKKVDILNLEEGTLVNGQWQRGRILNGDEKISLRMEEMPGCLLVELFQY